MLWGLPIVCLSRVLCSCRSCVFRGTLSFEGALNTPCESVVLTDGSSPSPVNVAGKSRVSSVFTLTCMLQET